MLRLDAVDAVDAVDALGVRSMDESRCKPCRKSQISSSSNAGSLVGSGMANFWYQRIGTFGESYGELPVSEIYYFDSDLNLI